MTDLFRPPFLKELCARYGLSPSKQFGQNYLISQKPIDMMIQAAHLSPTDTVVEIGPGFGVLTLSVAPLVQRIASFEIEQILRPYWEQVQAEHPNISIVWGNALTHLPEYVSSSIGLQPYKVLANLPYQITSRAIRTILEQEHPPTVAVLMVQKEVAERIVAKPGDMSLLSVSVQYYGVPSLVCHVSRGSFWPSPKVDSAVICIDCALHPARAKNPTYDAFFFSLVRSAFANKRKQAWKNIADGCGIDGAEIKACLLRVCGNDKVRAEELSVEQWKSIATYVVSHSGVDTKHTHPKSE